jgi:bud site selection protein 31
MASNGMLSRYQKKKAPPTGWIEIQQVMDALEDEMKNIVAAPTEGKRKTEALWPVHQLNWQRSYVECWH